MRTVPCMAGCDGPMLSIIGSLGSSSWPSSMWASKGSIRASVFAAVVVRLSPEAHALVDPERRELAGRALAERDEGLDLVGGVVPAQRVPDELGVHQDAAQIRVPAEDDAHEIERLALEPVRAPP